MKCFGKCMALGPLNDKTWSLQPCKILFCFWKTKTRMKQRLNRKEMQAFVQQSYIQQHQVPGFSLNNQQLGMAPKLIFPLCRIRMGYNNQIQQIHSNIYLFFRYYFCVFLIRRFNRLPTFMLPVNPYITSVGSTCTVKFCEC